jgi:hypothetical protein
MFAWLKRFIFGAVAVGRSPEEPAVVEVGKVYLMLGRQVVVDRIEPRVVLDFKYSVAVVLDGMGQEGVWTLDTFARHAIPFAEANPTKEV